MRIRVTTALMGSILLGAAGVLPPPPVALAQVTAAQGATPSEHWKGAVELPGQKLDFLLTLTAAQDGRFTGVMDVPAQSLHAGALTDVSVTRGEIKFRLALQGMPVPADFTFHPAAQADVWVGQLSQGGGTFPATLERIAEGQAADVGPKRPQNPRPPLPYLEREAQYTNTADGTVLSGTLTLPEGDGPFPGAVLITGSGAQDRDESLLGHKPFLVIADFLTRHGIAVLRVDDRGVGGSTGDGLASTTADFAGDVLAGVEFLKTQPEIDARKIGLVGHSEGGIIAPMAAARSGDVAFIVLLAGTGMTGREILALQTGLILRSVGTSDELVNRQLAALRSFVDALDGGADADTLRPLMRELVISSMPARPDGADAVDERMVDAQLRQMNSPWFRYFSTYDPRTALRQVHCPVLALNGALDLQVPPKQNLSAIESALREGGASDVTIVEMPGLNHLFQTARTGSPTEYASIEETFAPAALGFMSDWILARTRPRR